MEPVDVEKLIGELEIAVDRLRSLYDQYFVGLEKLEPGVPRKDVDRRIYALRKEQIRNTALRFRFQTVLQRYNTYQTHWQRICREIENGTYKRHLIRAQRRFGSTRPPAPRSVRPGATDSTAPAALGFPKDPAVPLARLEEDSDAPSFEVDLQTDDEERPGARPSPPKGPPAALPERVPAPPAPRAAPGVWKRVAPVPAHAAEERASPAVPPRPAPPRPTPSVKPPPVAAKPADVGAAKLRVAPSVKPPPVATKPADVGAAKLRATPSLKPPPVAAKPADVGAARPPPPVSAAKSPPTASVGGLPEERLRELYAEYVGAKRRQNESTAAITFQAVAKSLRESGDRLRERHGKVVDFEVAVKDGKTILRPVLK